MHIYIYTYNIFCLCTYIHTLWILWISLVVYYIVYRYIHVLDMFYILLDMSFLQIIRLHYIISYYTILYYSIQYCKILSYRRLHHHIIPRIAKIVVLFSHHIISCNIKPYHLIHYTLYIIYQISCIQYPTSYIIYLKY